MIKTLQLQFLRGDCTGDGNQGSTNPPSNPNYPIEVPNGPYYTFAMEDNWPAFGDYDMNDLVLGHTESIGYGRRKQCRKYDLNCQLDCGRSYKDIGSRYPV